MQRLLEKIREILRNRRIRMFFTRFVSLVAAIVVFITTYALVLPAITLEKTASCGIDEHQHDDSCYEYVLTCGLEESEGHHHDNSCYTVTRKLECQLEEHQHSPENGCYDEEGNLICQLEEHTHDDDCYSEVKELTCGREESEGHHHTDACYEKVLVCDKEVHIHSAECYKDEGNAEESNEEAADQSSSVSAYEDSAGETETEAASGENLPDTYVPELDPLNMEAALSKNTGFYYFHAEEGQEVPDNSTEITDWQEVKEDTELAPTDLVKMYLPYTIPAGSLNETNPTARYRLPENIHLTDDQIKAINKNENGITAGYAESDPEYQKYLGAEAIEGDRTPDEIFQEDAQEYISAVVKAENVYDVDGLYGEKGAYLGQDLIFTFVPYSIEKNQITYDAEQNPVSAGEKITGWFACDFRLDQIDWIEKDKQEEIQEEALEETQEETDQSVDDTAVISVEKTAEILFVSEDKEEDIEEIKRTLKLVEKKEDTEDTVSDDDELEEETPEFQSGTLTADGDGYKIILDYTEEAKIPENASLSVREITAETDKEAYEACLAQAQQHVDESGEAKSTVDSKASRFFDIEIQVSDEDGATRKIEPAAPVSVNIQIADAPAASTDTADSEHGSGEAQYSDPTVLHFAEEGVEQIDSTTYAGESAAEKRDVDSGVASDTDGAEDIAANEDSGKDFGDNFENAETTQIRFEAESFSIYGVVYTVDFLYEVDGRTYEFTLPGGGFVSLRHLIELLGAVDGTNSGLSDIEDKGTDIETESFESENTVSNTEGVDIAGINEAEVKDVGISDATREFVADIANVEFSNPELLTVSRVDEETTLGQIKQDLGIEVQYSAELTKEQIEEINNSTVEAGDWALISMQPFTSEEFLTVTMKNGEVFTIKVTDAQISTKVLTADGETFEITITYNDEAGIPEGSVLNVREIEGGTKEYQKYTDESAKELALDDERILYARFFNIEIEYGEEKIEPKAPVQVTISHKEALEVESDEALRVVHFADQGTEVIDDISLSDDQKEVQYLQDSFSVVGEIQTGTVPSGPNSEYALVVKYDGVFYGVDSDGTLTPVQVNDENNPTSVTIGTPLLWTYNNGNLYHHTAETDINAGQLSADFYYKYLSLYTENGIYEEKKIDISSDPATNHWIGDTKDGDDVTLEVTSSYHPIGYKNAWTVRTHKRSNDCKVNYNSTTHKLTNTDGTYVLDVEMDNGILRVVRKPASQSSGVDVYFADVSNSVPAVSPYNHTVNHIDISVEGNAKVAIPLAYGIYYDANGNEVLKIEDGIYYEKVGGQWQLAYDEDGKALTDKNPIKVYKDLTITGEDIKGASVIATDKDGNPADNAFYISGYSANAPSGDDPWQVRIEGSFKVADVRPYTAQETGNQPNRPDIRAERLRNIIYYSVSVVLQNQDLVVAYKGTPLYNGMHQEMNVKADITVTSDRFHYWDQGNTCPALSMSNYVWQQDYVGTIYWNTGAIYTYTNPNDSNWWLSGIDNRLSGDRVTSRAELLGMEVTKFIVDQYGNQIALNPVTYQDNPLTSVFHVYEKTPDYESDDVKELNGGDSTKETHVLPYDGQYTVSDDLYTGYDQHTEYDLSVTIGNNGKGLEHNYNVTEGMYYIKEDPTSVAGQVDGADGYTYHYVQTHIETEYAWRDDQYTVKRYGGAYNEPVHVSPNYSDLNSDSYRSIPEVIGNYKDTHGSWVQENGAPVRNAFLPFYVYNVYLREGMTLDIEKRWAVGSEPIEGTEITAELFYAMRPKTDDAGDEIPEAEREPWPDKSQYQKVVKGEYSFGNDLITELTLKEDNQWREIFVGLPTTWTDESSGIIYEIDYYANETSVKVPGAGKTVVDEDAIEMIEYYKTTTEKTEPTGSGNSSDGSVINDGKVTFINQKGGLIFEKKWLRADGVTEYTPSSSPAVITAQLRRMRTVSGEDTEEQEELVTVTILAQDEWTNANERYNNGSPVTMWSGQVVKGSDLYFSVACNGTSNPSNGYSVDTGETVEGPVADRKPHITYLRPNSNEQTGITKDANVFVLRSIQEDSVITAHFGPKQESNETYSHPVKTDNSNTAGFGYYIIEKNDQPSIIIIPGGPVSEDEPVTIEGKVTNGVITLNQDNGWHYELSPDDMETGWIYYINTDPQKGPVITETGVDMNTLFNAGPIITRDEDGNIIYTCTNTSLTTEVWAEKDWQNASGTTMEPPEGSTVIFDLCIDGVPQNRQITLNGKTDVVQLSDDETEAAQQELNIAAVSAKAYESEPWKAFWGDLPVYDSDDNVIQYSVKEITGMDGFENLNEEGVSTGGTIINKQLETEINILKVNQDTSQPITGAIFKLEKYDDERHEVLKTWEDLAVSSEEGEEGTLKIEGLTLGKYKLTETETPLGYIKTGQDPEFEIILDDNGDLKVDFEDTDIVTYSISDNTFTIGNPPGAALPNTGGPGTRIFTILGSILILGAGVLLWRRRRLI